MEEVFKIIREIVTEFDEKEANSNFEQFDLDSYDLLELRTYLEQRFGKSIPDSQWIEFKTFQDIKDYYEKRIKRVEEVEIDSSVINKRQFRINMPHMVLEGLSEYWLFKELGDLHWAMICEALNRPSDLITDELNNRLYSTFTRIRIECSHSYKDFSENEILNFDGKLSRFGRGMFFNKCTISTGSKEINATLMTTFVTRNLDNRSLLKGEPQINHDCKASTEKTMPCFAKEYKKIRKKEEFILHLNNEIFSATEKCIGETVYEINPYQDINGVGLFYFAAYPLISDICERRLIQNNCILHQINRDWALESSTLARDIFYLGNCDLNDKIIFKLNAFDVVGQDKVKCIYSLYRNSDQQCIARVFTLKKLLI
jgi:probable biosynthetic protein (TIGR04098 family)